MKRVVIVGGGISGLAAAWAARREAARAPVEGGVEVVVLEREDAVGGKARTVERDGWRVEAGPTGFLDNEPVLDDLAEAAGLEKVAANQAAARRFLVRGGVLREIVPHPLKLATSGILTLPGFLRLACEPFIAQKKDGADESVWAFARRRLGAQAADQMIAPMVLGVFAGDAKKISLPAAFPRMAELEAEYGSLIKAMIKLKKKKGSGGPSGPGAPLTSFEGGLETLPRQLAARGGFDVRTGAAVEGIGFDESSRQLRVTVGGDRETIPADAVVVAGEAWAAADVVKDVAPDVANELGAIFCPPVAVVALGYGAEALAKCPVGFGALIPRNEGYRILGVLWDTHLFAGRSPEGGLLVRAMLGGATDPDIGDLGDSELTSIARQDVARLLGFETTPVYEECISWPRAIPQYDLGHLARVRRIDDALAALHRRGASLHLAGNALTGVAFGKASARGAAEGREAVANIRAR